MLALDSGPRVFLPRVTPEQRLAFCNKYLGKDDSSIELVVAEQHKAPSPPAGILPKTARQDALAHSITIHRNGKGFVIQHLQVSENDAKNFQEHRVGRKGHLLVPPADAAINPGVQLKQVDSQYNQYNFKFDAIVAALGAEPGLLKEKAPPTERRTLHDLRVQVAADRQAELTASMKIFPYELAEKAPRVAELQKLVKQIVSDQLSALDLSKAAMPNPRSFLDASKFALIAQNRPDAAPREPAQVTE